MQSIIYNFICSVRKRKQLFHVIPKLIVRMKIVQGAFSISPDVWKNFKKKSKTNRIKWHHFLLHFSFFVHQNTYTYTHMHPHIFAYLQHQNQRMERAIDSIPEMTFTCNEYVKAYSKWYNVSTFVRNFHSV